MMSDASKIPKRNDWKFGVYYTKDSEYGFSTLVNYYISYMFAKTLEMFKWNNLPDDMNSYDVEKFTQLKGNTFFLFDKDKNRYFILDGASYDRISWNYEPTKAILVNPALPEISGVKYELGKNAIMIRNDYLMLGLYQIFEKNSMDIANTDISIRYAQFNTRLKSIFTSDDDETATSINNLIDAIWEGRKPSAIVTTDLYKKSVEGIKYAENQSNDIIQLMELKQYQLAQFYIELCVNANYNMKREAINENEANMNEDALLPFIDHMLKQREKACEEINKLFGLNISVELSSSWKKINKEVKEALKSNELQNDILEKEAEESKDENAEEPTEESKEEGESDAS